MMVFPSFYRNSLLNIIHKKRFSSSLLPHASVSTNVPSSCRDDVDKDSFSSSDNNTASSTQRTQTSPNTLPVKHMQSHNIRSYHVLKNNNYQSSNRNRTMITIPTVLQRETTNTNTNTSNSTISMGIRNFSRKGGKMGQHLKTLDELAHRGEHEKAKEKRLKKKNKQGGSHHDATADHEQDDQNITTTASTTSSSTDQEYNLTLAEDETETIFDHGGDDDSSSNNNNNESPSLPDKNDVKARMMKVVNAMDETFRSIRGAEPTPELFEPVQVKAYGTFTPINTVAQVVITSPTQATLTCFDPENASAVREAVVNMGMSFNPRVEEGVVIVPIPRVSIETRKAIVKQLGTIAENSRQRIRRIRRAAQDVVKKGKDGNLQGISKDDAFRVGKDIDTVTEDCVKRVNEILDKKQSSVLAV